MKVFLFYLCLIAHLLLPINTLPNGISFKSETGYISNQMNKAIDSGDVEKVIKLINEGENINARGYDGGTLLIRASDF